MAGRRAGGAADRGDHVIIVAAAGDLRALGREAFDHPIGRIAPRVINMLGLADAPQTIVRQADAVAARQEQPARPVLADRMAGVDMVGEVQIDGIAPRSEEHTSELQSLMRISYAVFCLKKKKT